MATLTFVCACVCARVHVCVCAYATQVCLSGVVGLMPVATLTGVVVAVAVHTFQWKGVPEMRRLPWTDNLTMLVCACVCVCVRVCVHGVRVCVLTPKVVRGLV